MFCQEWVMGNTNPMRCCFSRGVYNPNRFKNVTYQQPFLKSMWPLSQVSPFIQSWKSFSSYPLLKSRWSTCQKLRSWYFLWFFSAVRYQSHWAWSHLWFTAGLPFPKLEHIPADSASGRVWYWKYHHSAQRGLFWAWTLIQKWPSKVGYNWK